MPPRPSVRCLPGIRSRLARAAAGAVLVCAAAGCAGSRADGAPARAAGPDPMGLPVCEGARQGAAAFFVGADSVQPGFRDALLASGALPAGAEPLFLSPSEGPRVRDPRSFVRRLWRHMGGEGLPAEASGMVVVALVDAYGLVRKIDVAVSSGVEPFDRAVERTVWDTSFFPGHHDGCRVATWMRVPVAVSGAPDD